MYIEPGANIYILQDIPITPDYADTLLFGDVTEQASYFMSKAKYSQVRLTYQRHKRGYARVGILADNLYNCNYMMFQNASFGNKWFYAFITGVEYVNNEVSEISFVMDILQSYWFDMKFNDAYIERRHAPSDNIGENIEPEPVNIGQYVYNNYYRVSEDTGTSVIIYLTPTVATDPGAYEAVYHARTFLPVETKVYPCNTTADAQTIKNFMLGLFQKKRVIAIYMCPTWLTDSILGVSMPTVATRNETLTRYNGEPLNPTYNTLDMYTPKNNKLFTYPYNYCLVDNGNGETLELKYEFFQNLEPTVEISGVGVAPVKISLRAKNYLGTSGYAADSTLNTQSLTISDFPPCPWDYDSFQQWISERALPIAANFVGAMATGAFSKAAGAVAMGQAIVNTVTEGAAQMARPNITNGNYNNSNLNFALNRQYFYAGRVSLNRHIAKEIDDFFTRYGYAENHLLPLGNNFKNRLIYTYIKTSSNTINGNMPADDVSQARKIFNSGITIWRNPELVGNYSVVNTPTGGA